MPARLPGLSTPRAPLNELLARASGRLKISLQPRHERTIDLLMMLAIGLAGACHAFRALTIQSPLLLSDEYDFLITGISYSNLRWAWDYSQGLEWGTYLYPFIISLTTRLPSLPLALKLINVFALVAVELMLYTSLKSLGAMRAQRVLFALFLVALPSASYVTLVMPDTLYAAAFWILICAFVLPANKGRLGPFSGALLLGVGSGFLTLVKPHGFFVYLAAAAALVCVAALRPTWRQRLAVMLLSIFALSVGYIFAAAGGNWLTIPTGVPNAFDLLGGGYGEWLQGSIGTYHDIRVILLAFIRNYCAIAALYAPALLSVGIGVIVMARLKPTDLTTDRGRVYLLFCGLLIVFLLSGLVLMNSVFFSFDDRLRFRYLNFVFPVLVFLALAFDARRFSAVAHVLNSRPVRIFILLTWLGCAVGFYFVARDSRLAFVDAPELYFAYHPAVSDHVNILGAYGPIVGIAWICAGGLLLVVTTVSPIVINVLVLLPLSVVSLLNSYAGQSAQAAGLASFDKIGMAAAANCSREPGKIAVVATQDLWVPYYAALFNIDRPEMFFTMSEQPDFPPSTRLSDPQAIRMVADADCVVSHVDLNSNLFSRQVSIGRIHLYQVRPDARRLLKTSLDLLPRYTLGETIDMGQIGTGTDFLGAGWSDQEPEYRWSIGNSAVMILRMTEPPPKGRNLKLSLFAWTYSGQNVGLEVNGKAAGQQFIGTRPERIEFSIPADAVQSDELRLAFQTPQAFSPATTGKGRDTRVLGIALYRFTLQVDETR